MDDQRTDGVPPLSSFCRPQLHYISRPIHPHSSVLRLCAAVDARFRPLDLSAIHELHPARLNSYSLASDQPGRVASDPALQRNV